MDILEILFLVGPLLIQTAILAGIAGSSISLHIQVSDRVADRFCAVISALGALGAILLGVAMQMAIS